MLGDAVHDVLQAAFDPLWDDASLYRQTNAELDAKGDPASPALSSALAVKVQREMLKQSQRDGFPEADARFFVLDGANVPSRLEWLVHGGLWYQILDVALDPAGAYRDCVCVRTEAKS